MSSLLKILPRFSFRPPLVKSCAHLFVLLVVVYAVQSQLHLRINGPALLSQHLQAEHSEHVAYPTTVVRPISCTPLPDIPGKSITTAVVYFPPNAFTPEHRHPGSVTAFVLRGAIRSQIAGGQADTFTTGQTWFEPPGAVHSFAHNVSLTDDAEILATFVADTNCGSLTIFD